MACIKASTDSTLECVSDDLTLTANLTRRLAVGNTIYQYDHLAAGNNHMRLLTFLSGEPSAKLSVTLNNAPFSTQDPPSYGALSYAWGSTKNPAFVTVGETGSDPIAVTQNLAAALQYLRYRDRPRTLWIDATCASSVDGRHIQAGRSGYRIGQLRGRRQLVRSGDARGSRRQRRCP